MSGIAGIVYFNDKEVAEKDLLFMRDSLLHRGEENIDFRLSYSWGAISFSNRRHTSPQNNNCIVIFENHLVISDDRIDNRNDLLAKLDCKNPQISNAQLILESYLKWGQDCLNHLIGDFVFVIIDTINKEVICGRDHIGAKPLYYFYKKGEVFAFASEVKALLKLNFVPKTLNQDKIITYLLWLSDFREYKETTFYKEVLSLKPAHILNANKDSKMSFFKWAFNHEKFNHLNTIEDYALQFKDTLTEAIKCRIQSENTVASHLSGGLDSSSVSAIAHSCTDRLITLHYDVPEKSCDEKEYAKYFLEQYPTEHHWVKPTLNLQQSADRMSYIFDRPDISTVPAYYELSLSQILKQKKVKVLLTGHEGDTVVGDGIEYLNKLIECKSWNETKQIYQRYLSNFSHSKQRDAKAVVESMLHDLISTNLKSGKITKATQLLFDSNKYLNISVLGYCSRIVNAIGYRLRKNTESIINSELVSAKYIQDLIDQEMKNSLSVDLPKNQETHFKRIYSGLIIEANEQGNHFGAYYQYDYLYPMLDKRLIEFSISVPDKFRFQDGYRRGIFRKAMEGILPTKIQKRTDKVNFIEHITNTLPNRVSLGESTKKIINKNLIESRLHRNIDPKISIEIYRIFYLDHWLGSASKF